MAYVRYQHSSIKFFEQLNVPLTPFGNKFETYPVDECVVLDKDLKSCIKQLVLFSELTNDGTLVNKLKKTFKNKVLYFFVR